jgi:hypothetical protein
MPQFTGSTFLGQLVIPEIWAQYINNDNTKTNRLLTSGAITADDVMGAHLQDPGRLMNIPVLNDLYGDPQDWNDTDDIKVNSLTTDQHNAIKFYQAMAYGASDLVNKFQEPMFKHVLHHAFQTIGKVKTNVCY